MFVLHERYKRNSISCEMWAGILDGSEKRSQRIRDCTAARDTLTQIECCNLRQFLVASHCFLPVLPIE